MCELIKQTSLVSIFFFLVTLTLPSNAHLPSYEGERVRNDNHFTANGFAEPVRGECDINAVGPTDENAGSANVYLGVGNTPPNFFCAFVAQDDWSFERPVDIIEATRTPSPDPAMLGIDLEEGYIPCSPFNQNPFQCPRQIADPSIPGGVVQLPGQCIDVGQPGDPSTEDGPDGNFHCAILPGAPRPRTSSVLFSTLTGKNDVDWGVYNYSPAYQETPIVGAPQVPACKENLKSFVTFAYAGPLGLNDSRTGAPLFVALDEAKYLPAEVRENLPDGYGIRVTHPDKTRPTIENPRPGYASGFAQNGWLLANNSVIECIDNFEKCLADQSGDLNKHYQGNDIFFLNEPEPVKLYLMWWLDRQQLNKHSNKALIDVSITTGVIDQFIVGDFINIGMTGPFSGNGRYIHGTCRDPRDTERVDIVIETN